VPMSPCIHNNHASKTPASLIVCVMLAVKSERFSQKLDYQLCMQQNMAQQWLFWPPCCTRYVTALLYSNGVAILTQIENRTIPIVFHSQCLLSNASCWWRQEGSPEQGSCCGTFGSRCKPTGQSFANKGCFNT
jgi:hypothetical protein